MQIKIEGEHFYIDLGLYNRLLQCFVLIDLKIVADVSRYRTDDALYQFLQTRNARRVRKSDHRNSALRLQKLT